jgi:alkaline phosphatase D
MSFFPISSLRLLTAGRYINKGNSKFGAVTMETLAEGDQGSLKYRLFVDGVETWNTVILSPEPTIETKSLWEKLKGT